MASKDNNSNIGIQIIFPEKIAAANLKKTLLRLQSQVNGVKLDVPIGNTNKIIKANENIAKSFKSISNGMVGTNKKSNTLWSNFLHNAGKFAQYMVAGGAYVLMQRAISGVIDSVFSLNSAQVELNKVMDISQKQMEEYTQESFKMADAIGRTASDFLDASAEFARAGFRPFDGSLQALSEQALLLANVSDGLDDTGQAAGYLISTMKAYNVEVEKSAGITDLWNQISNNMAIETIDLAEIFKRSSASMSQAGNSMQQLAALSTGAFEILRDAPRVATGLRTLSLRLRGIGEDGESIDGLGAKLQEVFMETTNGIVSIENENGGLRSTYDILKDLADLYNSGGLGDKQLGLLIEKSAGKRQADVITSLLKNWGSVEKTMLLSQDAMGSALIENEKIIQGLQGRLNLLSNAWEKFAYNTLDSDIVGSILDISTSLLRVIDNVGLMNILFSATLGILVAIKGIGALTAIYNGIKFVVTILPAFIASMQYGFTATTSLKIALDGATISANAFYGVLTFGLSIAITLIISQISKAVRKNKEYKESMAEVALKAEGFSDALDEASTALARFNKFGDEVDLSNATNSISVMTEALNALRESTDYYSTVQEIQEIEAAIAKYEKEIVDARKTIQDGNLSPINMDETLMLIDEYGRTLSGLKASIEPVTKAEKELLKVRKASGEYWSDFQEAMELQYGVKAVSNLEQEYKEFEYTLSDVASEMESLASINQSLNDGEKISLSTLTSLMEQYPEYAYQIATVNDSKQAGKNLTELLFEAERKRAMAILEQERAIVAAKESELSISEAILGATDPEALSRLSRYYSDLGAIDASIAKISNYSIGAFMSSSKSSSSATKTKTKELADYFDTLQEITTLQQQLSALESQQKIDGIDRTSEITDNLTKQAIKMKILNELRQKDLSLLEEKQKKDLSNVELTENIASLKNDIAGTSQEVLDIEIRKINVLKEQSELLDEQIKKNEDLIEKYSKQYEDAIKSAIDAEIDSVESFYKSLIDIKQAEIDAQKEKDDLEERELARKEKLLNIEKARLKLINVSKERTVKQFNTDGTFQFVADPKAVQSAQDELKDLEKDYASWNLANQKSDYIKQLELEKQAYEDSKTNTIESLNEKLTSLSQIESKNYLERITQLRQFVTDYNAEMAKMGGNSISVSTPQTSGIDNKVTESNIADVMKSNSEAWHSASSDQKKVLEQQNESLAPSDWTKKNGRWYTSNGMPAYGTGGYVNKPHMAVVGDVPESIIPDRIMPNFLANAVLEISKMMPSIKLPQMDNQSFRNGNSNNQQGTTNHISIAKVETKDANSFLDLLPTLTPQYT